MLMHGVDGTGPNTTFAITDLMTKLVLVISELLDSVATLQECVPAVAAVDLGVDKAQSSGSIAVKRERQSQHQTVRLNN